MIGHRALEKKQITQGNNRKVQNPSGSLKIKRVIQENSLIIKHYQGFLFWADSKKHLFQVYYYFF